MSKHDEGTNTADLTVALEGVISRIQGVRAARVVAEGDRVSEIHVVSSTGRAPKQLVRDVQSAAKASFDVDLDYRTVSIVQIDDDEAPADLPKNASGMRLPLLRVVKATQGQLSSIDVVLRQFDLELVGRARGASGQTETLVARAALDAISSQLGETAAEVIAVGVERVGEAEVAIALVQLATRDGRRTVSGSAVVASDRDDAIARATLDAVNRITG